MQTSRTARTTTTRATAWQHTSSSKRIGGVDFTCKLIVEKVLRQFWNVAETLKSRVHEARISEIGQARDTESRWLAFGMAHFVAEASRHRWAIDYRASNDQSSGILLLETQFEYLAVFDLNLFEGLRHESVGKHRHRLIAIIDLDNKKFVLGTQTIA
jgi:hypothetical protein